MNVYEIRRLNAERLCKGYKTQKDFAEAIDVDPTIVSRWFLFNKKTNKYYKNIGEDSARKIAAACDLDSIDKPLPAVNESVDTSGGQKISAKEKTKWPFSFSPLEILNLDPHQQVEIGEIVEDRLARFKAKNGPRRRKKSDSN